MSGTRVVSFALQKVVAKLRVYKKVMTMNSILYISYGSHCCVKQTEIALLVFTKRPIVAHVSSLYCAKVRNKSKLLTEIHSFLSSISSQSS